MSLDQIRQHWPAIVGLYEVIITGIVLFGFWKPSPDELAYVMGIPATLAGFILPVTHSNNRVLRELDEAP